MFEIKDIPILIPYDVNTISIIQVGLNPIHPIQVGM